MPRAKARAKGKIQIPNEKNIRKDESDDSSFLDSMYSCVSRKTCKFILRFTV